MYFTWADPEGPRKLVWSVIILDGPSDEEKEFTDDLTHDSQEYVHLKNGQQMASVSFLDGLQRVLLFSQVSSSPVLSPTIKSSCTVLYIDIFSGK